MDSDPWADAPPSPKPGSEYSSPPKPTGPSPLITEQIEQTAPVSQTEPSSSSSPSAADPSLDDGIDDFDDFDAPAAGPRASSPVGGDDGDDGFGDFGDFEEADEDGDDVVPGLADRDRSGQMAEVVDRRVSLLTPHRKPELQGGECEDTFLADLI